MYTKQNEKVIGIQTKTANFHNCKPQNAQRERKEDEYRIEKQILRMALDPD